MPGKRMMWTGLIGCIAGLIALAVCLILPLALGPNVSWGEAMLGIIPSALLTIIFLVLMLIGMAMAMGGDDGRRRRRSREQDWDDEDDDRFRRRSRRNDNDDGDEDDGGD
jgi:uncharacterized membrane protein